MTYGENVERYRLQAWRNMQRQSDNYPHRGTPARMNHLYKLMDYAKRAGINHLEAFDGKLIEADLNIGYAGKRLKDTWRDKGRIQQGKRIRKIHRSIGRDTVHYMSFGRRVLSNGLMPTIPIDEILLVDIDQIVFIRNHKVGEVRVRAADGTEHVYPWTMVEGKTEEEVAEAWQPLKIMHTRMNGTEGRVKPLFELPRFRRQK
jgi:hypothetical protein